MSPVETFEGAGTLTGALEGTSSTPAFPPPDPRWYGALANHNLREGTTREQARDDGGATPASAVASGA